MYANIKPTQDTKYDVILRGEVIASRATKAEAEAVMAANPHSVLRFFAEPDEL